MQRNQGQTESFLYTAFCKFQIAIEKFSTKRQHFLVLKSACKYNFLYLQAEMLLLF